jgi:hypothetical protein
MLFSEIKCPKVDMAVEDAKAFAARNEKVRLIALGKLPINARQRDFENVSLNK